MEESVNNVPSIPSTILTLESAEFLALLMKSMMSSQLNAIVLKTSSESITSVLNAKENQNTIQSPKHANVLQDIELMELETVLLDVESMKCSRMVNAAANQDTIPSMESVEFVPGTKFMIKVLESAESLVTQQESLISARKPVSVFLNTSKWLMEFVTDVLLTQLTMKPQKNVSVMLDTSRTLVFALLPAMPMKTLLTENVSVKKDTILLDTAVVSALLFKFTTQLTESAMLSVRTRKSGIPSSDLADVFQDTISSMEFALNVTPRLKSTITESNVVTAKKDTEKHQVKDVKESVFPSALSMKISL